MNSHSWISFDHAATLYYFLKLALVEKFFQKFQISIFQNPEFSENFPTKNIARRTDGKNTEKTNSGTNDKMIWQNW